MSAENKRKTRLQKLSGSDFEMVDGEPDIRGWDVKDTTGKRVGEVEELIFDYQSRKVRYLVVDMEKNDFDMEDKEVLVPIGIAELHENDDDVILTGITSEQLRSLPAYDEDRFDTDHENNVRNVFGGLGGAALAGGVDSDNDDYYNHEQYNDANLYRNRRTKKEEEGEATIPIINEELQVGKKEVETGGVRLRSKLVEKEVSEDITLRDEEVHVERNSVDHPASADDFKEEEIEVHESHEVPVINKEARVVEEIKLSKDVTERDETINDTVRSTDVGIENKDRDTTKSGDSHLDSDINLSDNADKKRDI
jgi:uncharacterized protein (TIGR02271 family)